MNAILLLALVFLAGMGCRKHSEAPSDSSPASASSAPAPKEAPNKASGGTTLDQTALLAQLTQAVRRYGVEQRRAPKSLEELVAQGYLPALPEAPAGKKFAISKNLEVYLTGR